MLCLQSDSAYTSFRCQQKRIQLQDYLHINISDLRAQFWLLVQTDDNWQAEYLPQLQTIIPHAQLLTSMQPSGLAFWVTPRIGTISPWSSKATDIINSCQIPGVVRIERTICYQLAGENLPAHLPNHWLAQLSKCVFDPLTESLLLAPTELAQLFEHHTPSALTIVDVLSQGKAALQQADQVLGLALDADELNYLVKAYQHLNRNPTDVELMMFAQVNSEHCRHKIFNADWDIDQQHYDQSLFAMIRHTHKQHPHQTLIAYRDNAAVLRGNIAQRFFADPASGEYQTHREETHFVLKVETHNHPTAISPFPGAATGSGGEIRDEAATGRGAYPKAGLCGFVVSHLDIPDLSQPWEQPAIGKPAALASPLTIMLQAPIGAAGFNNEFGRPNLLGFFRSFTLAVTGPEGIEYRGYHKPIMLAGGIGNIRPTEVHKQNLPVGSQLIVLGGPAMAIGLGGGAASSKVSGDNTASLDFASVQRANPEMQRRCQEVINSCWALGADNPILSIHDVGAGGLSNALPEIVAACQRGADFQLRRIPNAEPGMTPLEIWCNEAQERFVLACAPQQLACFVAIVKRERCPFAVVGEVTAAPLLRVYDEYFVNTPVELPMATLFEEMPRKNCQDQHIQLQLQPFMTAAINLTEAINRVLQFPCVSSKSFLITIGDRSVTGLVARDQMVGPWQTPVADVAVTCIDYQGYVGEAMAVGERPPVALINPAASARLAVGEALTNLAAAQITDLGKVALSANWMAAAAHPGEGANLYSAVKAIALELCPQLGIAIPVGKDSLSMQTRWQQNGEVRKMVSPLSVVVTAAAPVTDVRRTLTPQLRTDLGASQLLLIDLGQGKNRLGGSVLAQVYQQLGDVAADVDDAAVLARFFHALQALNAAQLIIAYHDRSDGGLLATLCEMMFASHCGITLQAPEYPVDLLPWLFAEELGVVIQVLNKDLQAVMNCLQSYELTAMIQPIATLNTVDEFIIVQHNKPLYQQKRSELQRLWTQTSYRLQALRDNPDCAEQEYANLLDINDPGLTVKQTFQPTTSLPSLTASRPLVAILREQGVNGQIEMAAAFTRVGFRCIDVHMSDIIENRINLNKFHGLAAGGGFSFGDVFGAGRGWAQSILHNPRSREQFTQFFSRPDTFTLGACNGCQMLADLKSIIPGAAWWPEFMPNQSQQFEARLSLVQIEDSPSIFLRHMAGSILPVVVAHGEGLATFATPADLDIAQQQRLITLRYVDHYHRITERYPFNPNGSSQGITGLTTPDGRVLIVMPHPERVFRTVQYSWHPPVWGEDGPWLQLFVNAREWVEKQ